MMSFSMRKLIGFRLKAEYDSRVLLLVSTKEVRVVTYSFEPKLPEYCSEEGKRQNSFSQDDERDPSGMYGEDDDVEGSDTFQQHKKDQ